MVSVLTQLCYQYTGSLKGFKGASSGSNFNCVNVYHWIDEAEEPGPGGQFILEIRKEEK